MMRLPVPTRISAEAGAAAPQRREQGSGSAVSSSPPVKAGSAAAPAVYFSLTFSTTTSFEPALVRVLVP